MPLSKSKSKPLSQQTPKLKRTPFGPWADTKITWSTTPKGGVQVQALYGIIIASKAYDLCKSLTLLTVSLVSWQFWNKWKYRYCKPLWERTSITFGALVNPLPPSVIIWLTPMTYYLYVPYLYICFSVFHVRALYLQNSMHHLCIMCIQLLIVGV